MNRRKDKVLIAKCAILQLIVRQIPHLFINPDSILSGKLEKYELPKRVKIVIEQWTPESELVTAAFKLKRKNISNFYKNDLKALYQTCG